MARNARKSARFRILISLGISVLTLLIGWFAVKDITAPDLLRGLLGPLLRLLLYIGLGLLIGQFVEATGWTRYLAAIAMPAFRFGNLGPRCSAAFTTAFFSGVAANAMLLGFYKENLISRRQLFLVNFINQFPAYFLHLPTTVFIVLPLTGWAGGLYFALTFLAVVLRSALFLLYGHLRLAPEPSLPAPTVVSDNPPDASGRNGNGIWTGIRRRLPDRLTSIAIYVVPIYIAVYMLNAMGLFDLLQGWMADAVASSLLPVEALSVVVLSFAAEFTSGFAAAGALMDAGVLSTRQTVLALLIGNVTAFPIRALRHQLPHYMGIYTARMGTQLLLMGQGLRVLSILLVGFVYYILT
jgi:hypothetical protein